MKKTSNFVNYNSKPRKRDDEEQVTFREAGGVAPRSMMLPHPNAMASSAAFAPPTEFRGMTMLDFGPRLQMSHAMPSPGASFAMSMSSPTFHTGVDFKAPPAAAVKPSSSSWTEEAKKTPIFVEPENPISISYGWNSKVAKLGPLPLFFPRDLVKLELPRTDFLHVLERTQSFLRRHSIQAVFEDSPASAKLQTVDRIEFQIKFWQAIDENNFYVDIQRYRGDRLKYCNIFHRLLDAIKGVNHQQSEDVPMAAPMNHTDMIKDIQAVVERLIPVETQQMEGNVVEAVIHLVHTSLTSRCFVERTAGLECLVNFTDMRHTMVPAARQGALIFLRGQAPPAQKPEDQDDLNKKCQEIQQIIFKILQHGEFEGDETLRQHLDGVSKDYECFMVQGGKRKRFPEQYEDALSGSTQKAMTIFVNSLEVVSCDQGSGTKFEQVLQDFFIQCKQCTNTDLYSTLVDCIDQCDHQMAIGYLACKAMRLLLSLFPPLKGQLQGDSRARGCVEKACQAGRSCHSLLETESKMLRDGILT